MNSYSIIRIGREYVVQADEKSILKVASRRRAVRLVTDARELLDSEERPQLPLCAAVSPSIERDPSKAS